MSGDSIELRNAARITAPFAGTISVLTVSAVAASQDLQACGPTAIDPGALTDLFQPATIPPLGLMNRYARLTAVSTTVWVLFGAASAAVSAGNAPSAGGVNGVNVVGGAEPIAPGSYIDVYISINTRWLGFIGAGAGLLVVRPSSRGGQG